MTRLLLRLMRIFLYTFVSVIILLVVSFMLCNDCIGVIAPGCFADLVVVDGNPVQEIQATRNVVMVFRDGRLVVDRLNKINGKL